MNVLRPGDGLSYLVSHFAGVTGSTLAREAQPTIRRAQVDPARPAAETNDAWMRWPAARLEDVPANDALSLSWSEPC